MTILAIVNASKEGQIESKMMKSRQMEEIREAKRREAEAKQEQRMLKLVVSKLWRFLSSTNQQTGGDQELDASEEKEKARCYDES